MSNPPIQRRIIIMVNSLRLKVSMINPLLPGKTIELNPKNADAYFNPGIVYYNQDKIDMAISMWNKVVEINLNGL